MAWNDLSMKEKAAYMKVAVANGITNLDDISNAYNSFAGGGPTETIKEDATDTFEGGSLPEVEITPTTRRDARRQARRNWFTQATLAAAMADRPEIMQASGWDYDANGNIYQGDPTAEGPTRLADSLNKISSIANIPSLGAVSPSAAMQVLDKSKYLTPGFWLSKAGHPILGTVADIGVGTKGTIEGIKGSAEDFKNQNYTRGAINAALTAVGAASDVQAARLLSPAYRAQHAYRTIAPASYDNPLQRGKAWLSSMLENKTGSPEWDLNDLDVEGYIPTYVKNRKEIATKAREDAWSIYLGQTPKNNIYSKNPDGSYSYNLNTIQNLSEGTFKPVLEPLGDSKTGYDYITGAGGGLTKNELNNPRQYTDPKTGTPETQGYQVIEDLWDLQPFNRKTDKLSNRVKDKIGSQVWRDKAQSLREYMYDKGYWGLDSNSLLGKATKWADRPLNDYRTGLRARKDGTLQVIPSIADKVIDSTIGKLNTRFSDFEAGNLLGGHPFMMRTRIPYHTETKEDPLLKAMAKFRPGMETTSSVAQYGLNPNVFYYEGNFPDLSNSINNYYAQGGPLNNTLLKPFSYEPIPAVRYGGGGAKGNIQEEDRLSWLDKAEAWVAGAQLATGAAALIAPESVVAPIGYLASNIAGGIIDGTQAVRFGYKAFTDDNVEHFWQSPYLVDAGKNVGELALDLAGAKALTSFNKAKTAGVAAERVYTGLEERALSATGRVGTGRGRYVAKRAAKAKAAYNAGREQALKAAQETLAKKGVRPIQGEYYQKKLIDEMASRGYGVSFAEALKSAEKTAWQNNAWLYGLSTVPISSNTIYQEVK